MEGSGEDVRARMTGLAVEEASLMDITVDLCEVSQLDMVGAASVILVEGSMEVEAPIILAEVEVEEADLP